MRLTHICQEEAEYAVITIQDPFVAAFDRISYPALSMSTKKKELSLWMCICMWTVFPSLTVLQAFRSMDRR